MGMQLTRFDRWLREKFVHETHVYSMRPAEVVPGGIKSEELPDAPGRKFKYRYISRNSKAADALIAELKSHNQMFTTRIVDRTGWIIPLVAPEGKSVTWWLAWVLVAGVFLFVVTNALRALWSNPEFQKNFWESIEILQG
ncbi:MAG: hypothetical protein AAGI48_13110 [Verrucomicrobiota bacterium]